MAARRSPRLLFVVIDAMKPAMLERAAAAGRTPTLSLLMEQGHYVPELVAAFPSVTPVCAASIATGARPDRHDIGGMNWYSRREERYVEYGTSFKASQAFGFRRSLTDTIYNLNAEHLAADVPTIFERLDDAGVRTAGTTYLMYRGRHRHEVSTETALTRLATTVFRRPVLGPRELFYADLYASQRTGCRSQLGLPGVRDQHSGCVGRHLVEQDLCDFLLLSLPDNDTVSHRSGPAAQIDALEAADRQIARVMEPAGGPEAFLEDWAVVVCSDHAQSPVDTPIDLFGAFDGFDVLAPNGRNGGEGEAEIALCPNSRAAQVYALDRDRRETTARRVERTLLALDGVELTMRLTDHPDGEAAVRSDAGELRFAPRGELVDLRGETWSVEGELGVLDLHAGDGLVRSGTHPDALGRIWAALRCPTTGDVLASARPGHEFVDWGGQHHAGGGSHGALHADDSFAGLIWCGIDGPGPDPRAQWGLQDLVPLMLGHFGLEP